MDGRTLYSTAYLGLYRAGYFYYVGAYLDAPPLGGGMQGGYSLWRYEGGAWVIEKDACEPGYECGPPQGQGAYEGEFRRVAGRPVDRP